jgi:hypothetical protein
MFIALFLIAEIEIFSAYSESFPFLNNVTNFKALQKVNLSFVLEKV